MMMTKITDGDMDMIGKVGICVVCEGRRQEVEKELSDGGLSTSTPVFYTCSYAGRWPPIGWLSSECCLTHTSHVMAAYLLQYIHRTKP
jgi:hypothetical protein